MLGLGLAGDITALVLVSAQPITVPELQLIPEPCDPTPAFQVMEDPYDSVAPTAQAAASQAMS